MLCYPVGVGHISNIFFASVLSAGTDTVPGNKAMQISVSQPPGRGTVPGTRINYTRPREVFLEFVILVF